MKNKLKVIFLIMIMLVSLTGCGSKTKTLSCTATSNQEYGKTTSLLKIKVKDDEVRDMSLTLNVEISEDKALYKQAMITQMRQKTSQVYETDKGIKAIFDMGSSYFNTLGITNDASYSELKQVLEIQGYTCEE